MEDGKAHFLSISKQIRGKSFIPRWFLSFCFGRGSLNRDFVYHDGDVGLHGDRHIMPGHELGVLEALGLNDRDLQSAVEHVDAVIVVDVVLGGAAAADDDDRVVGK